MGDATIFRFRGKLFAAALTLIVWSGFSSVATAGISGNSYSLHCTQISFFPPSTVSFDQTVEFFVDGTFLVSDSGATGSYWETDFGPFSRFTGTFDAGGSFVGFRFGNLILMHSQPTPQQPYLQICRGARITR